MSNQNDSQQKPVHTIGTKVQHNDKKLPCFSLVKRAVYANIEQRIN